MAQEHPRRVWLVADDYGLSPGVGTAIRALLRQRRLSGTGCMTLFDDWHTEAKALAALDGPFAIGMHLTLTDFPALSDGRTMPGLKRLIATGVGTHGRDAAIFAEADAQLENFRRAFGTDPAFIDGHQHVHFLPPVRRWLETRFGDGTPARRPWLRGAPTQKAAPREVAAKIAFARFLARGFDARMRRGGFRVHGPLCGFYDWRRGDRFAGALGMLLENAPDGSVVMCHPGRVDAILRQRDVFTDARETENEVLSADDLPARLEAAGLTVMGSDR